VLAGVASVGTRRRANVECGVRRGIVVLALWALGDARLMRGKWRARRAPAPEGGAVSTSRLIWWCSNRPQCDAVLGVIRNGTVDLVVGAAERVCWDEEGGFTVQCKWCRHWTSRHVVRCS
jgi:hypothetical protein